MKPVLVGMTLDEIANATRDMDIPAYAAREIALWIYRRSATDFNQFTNISKKARSALADSFELGLNPPQKSTWNQKISLSGW